ncbi:hypothetical protein OAC97_03485 [Flavobacteriaceae bacterium]|nr:hypothetical protein [Flavobacteriaceae bacterium]
MSINKYKILSLGSGQSNFLSRLYTDLKRHITNLSFTIDDYNDLSKTADSFSKSIFEKKLDLQGVNVKKTELIIYILKIFFNKSFLTIFFFEIKNKISLVHSLKIVKRNAIYLAVAEQFVRNQNYNLYHFHFCVPYNLRFIHYLPKNSKIICSFWGSDLYRRNSKEDLFYVKLALLKISAITVHTTEMKRDLLKKYNINIESKIHLARKPPNTKVFGYILTNTEHDIRNLKVKLAIPLENKIITVGYNAFEENNHLEILKHLYKIPKSIRSKITIILPLAYGRKEEYLQKLKEETHTYVNMHIVFYDDFLNSQDLSLLRMISNIQIQMPISDALSHSITEVLFTGNDVIAGSWLPYQFYNRIGVKLYFIEDFSDLPKKVIELIKKNKKTKSQITSIQKVITENFYPQTTIKPWVSLYKKLLNVS